MLLMLFLETHDSIAFFEERARFFDALLDDKICSLGVGGGGGLEAIDYRPHHTTVLYTISSSWIES